ncbi:sarcosine oxidase subunit delta [Stappia sp.]|jgi:sarcosine oxidase subunit delta|uniref:sarcosine oxidase subunit delta n=1 Tax=Stappia sp. TaxID=1870903 RepID=UPI003A9A50A5
MRIDCPCCGLRDVAEFSYGGDGTLTRPDLSVTEAEPFAAYVYDRENPRGPHTELWHHISGCRHWLRVVRDTATHEILSVEPAGRAALFAAELERRA